MRTTSFSMTLTLCVYAAVSQGRRFWLDTDSGGDPDDIFALGLLIDANVEIVGVSTVNHQPHKKAEITRFILNEKAPDRNIPVYAGFGNRERVSKVDPDNPYWPSSYPIYEQGIAFAGRLGPFSAIEQDGRPQLALEALYEAASKTFVEGYGEKLQVICIGPLLNIARAFETYPDLPQMIEIYAQGGVKNNRLGYNFGVNLEATKLVVNSGVSMTIVDGQFIIEAGLVCSLDLIRSNMPRPRSDFGQVIYDDWANWMRATPFDKQFGDPMTVFTALNPESFIVQPQKYEFAATSPTEKGFLAPGLVTVENDGDSPVCRITFSSLDAEILALAKGAISLATSRILDVEPFNFFAST